jgi:short-subunit dehydrogenase
MAVPASRNVIITGASSGIGAALAARYAREGGVLGLVGRDRERLERVAEQCRANGCEVRLGLVDVRDRAALGDWLREFDRAAPIDLVVANAGTTTGMQQRGQPIEDAEAAFQVMQINVLGVMNTVHPVLPLMLARGRGQIAIMSSIAAILPLPDSPSYSASKASVLAYGLALRDRLHGSGVRVNVLCPGYITSPMSARIRGWKPLEMSPEYAAERMARGLARDRGLIAFPWSLIAISRFASWLPGFVRRPGMKPFRFYVARPPNALAEGNVRPGPASD